MITSGVHLTLLIGKTIPIFAPPMIMKALHNIEVTHSDEKRSGFQINFRMGRAGPADILDYKLLTLPLLRPFNRVVILVTFNARVRVLMDGIITHQQLKPGNGTGSALLTVTGEDISLKMDTEEKTAEHPAQNEVAIALKIITSYAQYGLIPLVIPPAWFDIPLPIERIPAQHGTDLEYLQILAKRFGYVSYINPGPAPLTNLAYWGPPIREGIPQKALSVDLGSATNVDNISFENDAMEPALVKGRVQDRDTNKIMPVQTAFSRRIPLVSQPSLATNFLNVRKQLLKNSCGLRYTQAFEKAQSTTDQSVDEVVKASGELDALKYGDLLSPRGLVGLRGVGFLYDGFYYVKSVTHNISEGKYNQSFTLTREGVGSITPVVRV